MPNNNKKNRSDARKNKAQRSWAKRQEEKARNKAENEKKAAANRALRAQGLETPYQKSQRERRQRHEANKTGRS